MDLLIELTEIRLSQQEDKLQELRHEIQRAMSQINECLDQLDSLDENAKVPSFTEQHILFILSSVSNNNSVHFVLDPLIEIDDCHDSSD